MSSNNENSVNLGNANHWSSFKHLENVVQKAITSQTAESLYEFEHLLKRHKNDFTTLAFSSPTPVHRELVKSACKDGIMITQNQSRSRTVLPESIVEEALLLSDMFKINELIALELIITGSNHEARYPGMSRGPIAVLLYYDCRRSLLNTFELLLHGYGGRTWRCEVQFEIKRIIDTLLKDISELAINECLQQLTDYDRTIQFDLLQRNSALGPCKYKRQVFNLIKEIHQLYANIVYTYAAQLDLSPKQAEQLLDILAKRTELDSTGCIDNVSTTLLFALLYTLDVSPLQTFNEQDIVVKQLPLIKHKTMFNDFVRLNSAKTFSVKELQTVINFTAAITLKTFNLFPQLNVNVGEFEDDQLLKETIEAKVFKALNKILANNPYVKADEFYFRRLHNLIVDFIAFCPLKLKELRDECDDVGRLILAYSGEGIEPPATLARHFEDLLQFMADFYAGDKFGLTAEIWRALDGGELAKNSKMVSVHKFVRSTVDSFLPHTVHQPILAMLASLARCSPLSVYNLLKANEINHHSSFSLNQFYNVFNNYFQSLRYGKQIVNPISGQILPAQTSEQIINISSLEVDILCNILQLFSSIVKRDRACCLAIAENQRFCCITTFVGLLVSSVASKLKAALLSTLAAFATGGGAAIALNIWLKMEPIFPKRQVAITQSEQHKLWQTGIAIEIEELEPRSEIYPITIAFLRAVRSLVTHIACNRQSNVQTSVEYTIAFVNSVFVKSSSRAFKQADEKWKVKLYSLKVMKAILETFEPFADGVNSKAAFALIAQLLEENVLFRRLMEMLEDGLASLEPEVSSKLFTIQAVDERLIKKSIRHTLQVLNILSTKEAVFMDAVHALPGYPMSGLMKLSALFCNINPNTDSLDRLATLVRILSLPDSDIQVEALTLLRSLVDADRNVSQQLQLQIQPFTKQIHRDYFTHVFVECLEADDRNLALVATKFLLTNLQKDCEQFSFYGFAHRLLGFDRSKQNLFIPGSKQQTFTCLHALLAYLENSGAIDDDLSEVRCVCMQILHTLCADVDTGSTTLRFIRTSYDLLARYHSALQRMQLQMPNSWLNERNIDEVAWFWKVLALELNETASTQLKSHYNVYVKQLLGDNGDRKLTIAVPAQIYSHVHPTNGNWEYFDSNELWRTIAECTKVNNANSNLIDVKFLHQKLITEMKLVAPQLGSTQSNVIQSEIEKILVFVTCLNESNVILQSKVRYFEGWRELIEILLSSGLDVIDNERKCRLLFELIEELLQKFNTANIIDALLTPISSIVLLAATSIRSTNQADNFKTHLLATAATVTNILESSASLIWKKQKRARVNLYGTLLHVHQMLPPSLSSELQPNERLLVKLCKDVLDGHEINKVLAISLLNKTEMTWIHQLDSDGTMRLLIDSLQSDDHAVKAVKYAQHCKAFYSFEAKMSLLMRIATDPIGGQTLIHLRVIDVLSKLECFEVYPFVVGQSEICLRMFASILRLLVALCGKHNRRNYDQVARFLSIRATVFNDLLRSAFQKEITTESETILVLCTSLISQLILQTSTQLQRTFLSLINVFNGKNNSESHTQILANVLYGFFHLSQSNCLLPLFAPSWSTQKTFVSIGQPTLGLLLTIIENCVECVNKSNKYLTIIEFVLYLLWHHLNLYFTLLAIDEDEKEDVNRLQVDAATMLSDVLLSRVQNAIKENDFVDALIRRIKTVVLSRT